MLPSVYLLRLLSFLLGFVILVGLLPPSITANNTTPPLAVSDSRQIFYRLPPSTSTDTVILADRSDPYYSLAEEIARSEDLPLVNGVAEALTYHPVFLLWVVAPDRLSDQTFSQFGQILQKNQAVVSVGIITGSTPDKARALWQRKLAGNEKHLVVIPREHHLWVVEDGQPTALPLSKADFIAAIQQVDYGTFQGHGSRRHWLLEDTIDLIAADIPRLPPLLINALACQTLKIWGQDSIALRFVDQGAAAYVGFVHSPLGYSIGEPDEFSFYYTWPEFPIGHVVQVQNHGYLQGFLAWPFYFMLGDPRLSFLDKIPYALVADDKNSDGRVLTYRNAPKGVIPVYIPDGAQYSFVEIPGVARAWEKDPFYNKDLQLTNINSNKYLLFIHQGGDFTVKLYHRPPWYHLMTSLVIAALDHTTVIYNAQGSIVPSLIVAGFVLLVMGWFLVRRQVDIRRHWPGALATGLALTLFRGGYGLARQEYLTALYTNRLRTVDVAFDINGWVLVSTLLVATCGAWLFFDLRSRWAKSLVLLAITLPSWIIAIFWLSFTLIINLLARREYGLALYGYGSGVMALITFAVEGLVVVIILLAVKYYQQFTYSQ